MGKGYKVLVCGMASVGKTAILEQVLYGKHDVGAECSATSEDVYVALAETDRGVKEQLRLYDTRGVQEGEEFPKHYFSLADGFVLVYAVNSLESFERADWLKKEIDKCRDKREIQPWFLKYGNIPGRLQKDEEKSTQNIISMSHMEYFPSHAAEDIYVRI
ncbi:NF-kappa-B inhibitor-interacting Ras-like protein 1 isoform X2 [Podarcis muralis]